MIKFFGKIRQNLLSEGKTGKYLKYAIGEIILVVVGILIALSISNWNESRKEKTLEKKVMDELKKSLENNYNEMLLDSLRRVNWNRSSDIIISVLREKAEYSDSLNIHFHNTRLPGTNLSLSTASYE
jgi:chlorite dismutase